MGLIGGLLGAGFHHVLHFVTHFRGEHTWLVFLPPLGGLLTVGLYRFLRLQNNRGTNAIIDATVEGKEVSPLIAPAMPHLFGGSAGREGAALGLVGLFCCATNSPFASIVLGIEMFGSANLHLFALFCVICFVLSGHSGMYASQIIQFNKAGSIPSRMDLETS